jgi:hypothetical protein
MTYKDAGLAESGMDVIAGLQKVLVSEEAEMHMESVLEGIGELKERLNRVRSWGGVYSQIEFSPQIEVFLSQKVETKIAISA